MSSPCFQRGITFRCAASPTTQALARSVASTFGLRTEWTHGATRLIVIGARESVDAFFSVARTAISLAGPHPAVA